jgi:hypothetical protein
VAIEDGNPDKVGESVNFAKFRMLYRQIQELRAYQQPTYAIPINDNIRAFLRSVHAWSEDDLFLTSARLEPGSRTNRRTYNTIGREEGRK